MTPACWQIVEAQVVPASPVPIGPESCVGVASAGEVASPESGPTGVVAESGPAGMERSSPESAETTVAS